MLKPLFFGGIRTFQTYPFHHATCLELQNNIKNHQHDRLGDFRIVTPYSAIAPMTRSEVVLTCPDYVSPLYTLW